MAKKHQMKFSREGFRKLRKDPRITQELLRKAKAIQADAGGEALGYKVTDLTLEDPRAAVSVMATGEATFHNKKHHALLRALNKNRGRA